MYMDSRNEDETASQQSIIYNGNLYTHKDGILIKKAPWWKLVFGQRSSVEEQR